MQEEDPRASARRDAAEDFAAEGADRRWSAWGDGVWEELKKAAS